MTPALSLDLASLRRAYRSGALTPAALVDLVWQRCEELDDPAVWIHRLSREVLREHAARITARGPEAQPLYGIPFAIKDNIDLAGSPTTAACPAFAFRPAASASVVQRLLEAGAIPIGKTNLDQFATGLVGVRSPYGTPRNPFRLDTIPGGSSSGSAVAVATGLVSFSLGTDTAGSGRVPAGFNNLVGLKPTRGALSTRGVVPACRSLDCVSIFALSCADAADVLRVAEGVDRADPYSRRRALINPYSAIQRIGVPAPKDRVFFGDDEAERRFADSLARVSGLGGTLVEIDFAPFRETAALLYQGPWVAERWAELRQFHARHADEILPITRQILEGAAGLSAAAAFDGFHQLAALARLCEAEWAKMDMLLVPTAPRPYTTAAVAAEPILLNSRLGVYTNFVNLLDLAAVSIPSGFRGDGLPWGVTLIAPAWQEAPLLAWGARWHATVGGRLGATAHSLVTAAAPTAVPAAETVRLAVVGAHLSGLPLNPQLTDRGARLVWSGQTSPSYRLYALPNTVPAKPGLARCAEGGTAIAVEVWEMGLAAFGSFVAAVPAPLCIGTIELATGATVKGFLCEGHALAGATEISSFGGWKAYRASAKTETAP